MSGVNISILEGGKAENFGQVTKLRTSNGTGRDLWVPKSDVETKHLSVKKNGLHYTNQYEPTAAEKKEGKFHDVYGWDTITVSVKKKVKGKKKKIDPSTGLETDVPVVVDVDDDENLVETELPTSIKITKKPKNLNYVDGQDITIDGIVVHGYLEDGTDWGEVPFDELSFEPTVAEAGGTEWTDGDGVVAKRIDTNVLKRVHGLGWDWSMGWSNKYIYDSDLYQIDSSIYSIGIDATGSFFVTAYNNAIYLKRIDTSGWVYYLRYNFEHGAWEVISAMSNWSGFYKWSDVSDVFGVPLSTKDPTQAGELQPAGGTTEVTVSWLPDDLEEELTDTYEITVGQGPIPSNS